MTAEMLWIEAMDNESLSINRQLIGTEEGQQVCRERCLNNVAIYADMFGVDQDEALVYFRARQF